VAIQIIRVCLRWSDKVNFFINYFTVQSLFGDQILARGSEIAKKCHILFEWPLNGLPSTYVVPKVKF